MAKSRRVAVTLPADELSLLEEKAKTLGLSVSALVRVILLRKMEQTTGEAAGVDQVLAAIREPARGQGSVSMKLKPSRSKVVKPTKRTSHR